MDRYVFKAHFRDCEKRTDCAGDLSVPSLAKGEVSAVQGDLTHKECSGTWNKGGFLLKETQSVSESSSIILNDLGLDGYPKQFSSLTSIYLINETDAVSFLAQIFEKKKKRLE